MADIFELLGIDRKTSPHDVKKAYLRKVLKLHPDRNGGKESQAFLDVQAAWERYRNRQLSSAQTAYTSAEVPSPAAAPFVEESDALMIPRQGYIKVFVLTPWSAYSDNPHITQDEERYCYIRKGHAPALQPIVNQINDMLSRTPDFVGIDRDEAIQINNQHKHRERKLIVEVEVPLTRLSESKSSEQEGCNALNAASGQFFYLVANTKIALDDIVSVEAIPEACYQNTRAFAKDRISQEEYWPNGYIYYPSVLAITQPQTALALDLGRGLTMPAIKPAAVPVIKPAVKKESSVHGASNIFELAHPPRIHDRGEGIIRHAWRETYEGNSRLTNIVTGIQKLFFEFLPRCFELAFQKRAEDSKWLKPVFLLAYYLTNTIRIVLRPVSSPIKSMHYANDWRKRMAAKYGIAGNFVGCLAMIFSGAISVLGNAALLLTPIGFAGIVSLPVVLTAVAFRVGLLTGFMVELTILGAGCVLGFWGLAKMGQTSNKTYKKSVKNKKTTKDDAPDSGAAPNSGSGGAAPGQSSKAAEVAATTDSRSVAYQSFEEIMPSPARQTGTQHSATNPQRLFGNGASVVSEGEEEGLEIRRPNKH